MDIFWPLLPDPAQHLCGGELVRKTPERTAGDRGKDRRQAAHRSRFPAAQPGRENGFTRSMEREDRSSQFLFHPLPRCLSKDDA